MPIYEYKCKQCGAAFETIVISTETTVRCRACGGDQVERQLSTFAVNAGGSASPPKSGSDACFNCPSAQQGLCQMRH